jgi:large subunit ribosomal protein L25
MNISVECQSRPEGSKPRALRREGLIPAALYGHDGAKSISLTIPAKEAQILLRDAAINNTLIDLKIPDIAWKGKALIREVQAHPWKRTLHHLSFFTVSAKQLVEIVVPVILTGKAAGTKEGGIVDQSMTELKIACAADSIPESIEIDITNFEIGTILHVGEIVLPNGATALDDLERIAISIVLPSKPTASDDAEAAATEAAAATTES